MVYTTKLTYELTWEEAEEILQNLLDNNTVDLHPYADDPRLLKATSSEQELDAGEVDERFSQYFGVPCICWATKDGIIAVTDQPLYALTHYWDDDSGSGADVLAVSASQSELSKILLAETSAFQENNIGIEWNRDTTEIPVSDDPMPLYASFGWKHGHCENIHRWSIAPVETV